MVDTTGHPALERILKRDGAASAFELLRELPGTDLTSFLLGLFERRAHRVAGIDAVRQYERDRFVAPSPVDGLTMARLEVRALEAARDFEPVALAPVAPFGTHLAMGATPQNNVVSTVRNSEVAADPTNSLVLEAVARRRRQRREGSDETAVLRLAAVHRVTRAQRFEGARSFAHFSVLGLVSAGRDRGNHEFEIEALLDQIEAFVRLVASSVSGRILVRVTPFVEGAVAACDEVRRRLSKHSIDTDTWTTREHGRGYYRTIGFKLFVEHDGVRHELGDGGDVWWTRDLLQNRKERLVIGGVGLERLAMLAADM